MSEAFQCQKRVLAFVNEPIGKPVQRWAQCCSFSCYWKVLFYAICIYLHTSFVRLKHLAMQTCFYHLSPYIFSIAGAIFKRRICDWKNLNHLWAWCECHDIGARNAIEIFWSWSSFGDVASAASHDIGARNAIEIFSSRPSFGDVASAASHDIGARNAIENFLNSTNVWRCCEWRQSRIWREKCDWNFSKSTKLWRCCEWR